MKDVSINYACVCYICGSDQALFSVDIECKNSWGMSVHQDYMCSSCIDKKEKDDSDTE